MRRKTPGSPAISARASPRTLTASSIPAPFAGGACSIFFDSSLPWPSPTRPAYACCVRIHVPGNGSHAMRYADAGVNIAVADEAKQRIRHLATRTFTNGVLGGIGSFGALFALDTKKFKEPILVSIADCVRTKLKIAMAMDVHSTVGGDLVNHCVNDILVQGDEPLFFLYYLALGQTDPHVIKQLVDCMSPACRSAGCALI